MSPVFAHGDLRLYLLKLLEERARHGYDLIRLLEDRFLGLYTPSAGTVYPRLTALEEDGLVAHEMIDGRKVYRLTDAGRAELAARRHDLSDVERRVRTSTRDLAKEIRAEVKSSIRDARDELRDAARQVRREDRRARHAGTDDWHEDLSRDVRRAVRSLSADVRSFASDLVTAARTSGIDEHMVDALRQVVVDARSALADAVDARMTAREHTEDEPA